MYDPLRLQCLQSITNVLVETACKTPIKAKTRALHDLVQRLVENIVTRNIKGQCFLQMVMYNLVIIWRKKETDVNESCIFNTYIFFSLHICMVL